MNYFLQELRRGNKAYWLFLVAFVIWMVALIDMYSSAINPPGLFNGKLFKITLILTFVIPIIYYIYDYLVRSKKRKETALMEKEAAVFEPLREQEIRKIVEDNPEFVTLCYQCIHFDSDLRQCAKKLSNDVIYHRVKEIKINQRSYCLYWQENSEQHQ